MFYLWNYPDEIINKTINIHFGNWSHQLFYLDEEFDNLATKIIYFFKESGQDPYERFLNAEPLVDFAICKKITYKPIEYIYRHYVYNLISKHENIDIEKEEEEYYLQKNK